MKHREHQIRAKSLIVIFLLLVFGYIATYAIFRQTHKAVWDVDKSEYVIFPEDKILYYLYRPIVLIDGSVTGMKFHIGPHQ